MSCTESGHLIPILQCELRTSLASWIDVRRVKCRMGGRHGRFPRKPTTSWRAASSPPCPHIPGGFGGRGIVICAGGHGYSNCGYVCARMLRFMGCQLRIQFWRLDDREIDDRMRTIAAELTAVCIDAEKVKDLYPARILNGWTLKPFALRGRGGR